MSESGGFGRGWRGRQQGWDPMGELQSLRAELSRLVGGRSGSPDLELNETADGWEVVVRLPGGLHPTRPVAVDQRAHLVEQEHHAEPDAQPRPG